MKKILTHILLAAALLPLLFACDPLPDTTPHFAEPAYVNYACHLSIEGLKPSTKAAATKAPVASILVSVELTESGMYVLGWLSEGESGVSYTTGRYTVSGNEYKLAGYGTLSFDNSQAGMVTLTLKPDGKSAEVVKAKLDKPVGTNAAFRTWNVEKTRITAQGWVTVSAEFTGCNLKEIADFLRANSHKAPEDVADRSVKTITLTGTERMILGYSDGSADLNKFSLNGNVLTYTFSNGLMGFTFETDRAVIEYENGKCLLSIDGRIRNSTTSGSVSFVLSPAVEN